MNDHMKMEQYKHWHSDIQDKKTIMFLRELFLLYEKYNRSIAHEDWQGAFIIEGNCAYNRDWIRSARDMSYEANE